MSSLWDTSWIGFQLCAFISVATLSQAKDQSYLHVTLVSNFQHRAKAKHLRDKQSKVDALKAYQS
mgnify:FL=1